MTLGLKRQFEAAAVPALSQDAFLAHPARHPQSGLNRSPTRVFQGTLSSAIVHAVPISFLEARTICFLLFYKVCQMLFDLATEASHDKHALSRRQSRISGPV